jgi:tetratricopeptide (TPR) repeat protein
MAEFVLSPPPDVTVISFFITARLAGQNTRTAFCEVVQRQLYAFLDEEEPPVTEHTRDELFLHALERVASKCATLDKRLVLVVDGLDEDRSVEMPHGGHSIAALLPAIPPHGMRIIVAGRPHPPIPRDVPQQHPLRTNSINHRLTRSPHAAAIRVEAENSLDELIEKGGLAYELLGLVAAAGGGLSAEDLANLTQTRQLRVRRTLDGTVGRIFVTSPSIWTPSKEVYLLGHEEIQNAALDILSEGEIAEYRTRICSWADQYKNQAWPVETPEYLLSGYAQLLRSIGDLDRLSKLAYDSDRHERLWRTTGSDLDALTEVATALDLHRVRAQEGRPDVATSLLVAMARDALRDRTNNVPEGLVVAWAILGNTDRAINLALSYSDHARQIKTLATAGRYLLKAGEVESALLFANLSVEVAQSSSDFEVRAIALAGTVAIYSEAGQSETARQNAAHSLDIAETFNSTPLRVRAISQLVSLIGNDSPRCMNALTRAVEDTRSVAESATQAEMLIQIAQAMTHIGRSDDALEVAIDVRDISHSVISSDAKASLFCQLSQVASSLGNPDLASNALKYANKASAGIYDFARRSRSLVEIVAALADTGRIQRALDLTEQITEQEYKGRALAYIAGKLADTGEHRKAEELARAIVAPNWRAQSLADLAIAVARAGDISRAIILARSIEEPSVRAQALAEIAVTVSCAGQRSHAERIAAEAAETARDAIEPSKLFRAITDITEAVLEVDSGVQVTRLIDQAAKLARDIPESDGQARHLARAASFLAQVGQYERALSLASEAAEIAIVNNNDRSRAFHDIAVALAKAEEDELAQEAIHKIRSPGWEPLAIGEIAYTWALRGRFDDALKLVDSIRDPGWFARTLARLAGVMEGCGDQQLATQTVQRAVRSASGVMDPRWRTRVLADIAESMASAGAHELAASISLEAVETARIVPDRESRIESLARAACALANAGAQAEAARIAEEAGKAACVALSPEARCRVLTHSAVTLARAASYEQALAMVSQIKDPRRHGRALAKVAGEFGSSMNGRRVFIEALQLLPWIHTCDVLARVSPEAALVAANQLLNRIIPMNPSGVSAAI